LLKTFNLATYVAVCRVIGLIARVARIPAGFRQLRQRTRTARI
jgi:hypothetical protein